MSKKKTPSAIQVGIEVEVNWPGSTSLPRELHEAAWPALRDICRRGAAQTMNLAINSAPVIAQYPDALPAASQFNQYFHAVWTQALSSRTSRLPNSQCQFLAGLPAPYCLPEGWLRMTDGSAGQEFKFDGPTNDEAEIVRRIENLVAFLNVYGLTLFTNAGTHIHFGMIDWLNQRFGKSGILRTRAETLAHLYFNTRSNVLHKLVPPIRRANEYCQFPWANGRNQPLTIHPSMELRIFDDRTSKFLSTPGCGVTLPQMSNITFPLDHRTPSWAIHNMAIVSTNAKGVCPSGAIVNQRHLPTFEFRLFPGTGSKYDILGYYRMIRAMFNRFETLIQTEANLGVVEKEAESPLLVNPHQFNIKEFLAEITSPALREWISQTYESNGICPQNDTADTGAPATFNPEGVAA